MLFPLPCPEGGGDSGQKDPLPLVSSRESVRLKCITARIKASDVTDGDALFKITFVALSHGVARKTMDIQQTPEPQSTQHRHLRL